jgi:hypothetical protein
MHPQVFLQFDWAEDFGRLPAEQVCGEGVFVEHLATTFSNVVGKKIEMEIAADNQHSSLFEAVLDFFQPKILPNGVRVRKADILFLQAHGLRPHLHLAVNAMRRPLVGIQVNLKVWDV